MSSSPITSDLINTLDMAHTQQFDDSTLVGGQPSAADLQRLKDAGFTAVINLRGPQEDAGYDEAGTARSLELTYISQPIAGSADVTREQAEKLAQQIDAQSGPILIHCQSANRVGALFALQAAKEGKRPDEALDVGKRAGLKGLEALVRSLIS